MNLHLLTAGMAILLLIYHQVTTWLPMYPWNNVSGYSRKELLLEAASNGLMMGTAVFCLLMKNSGFYHYYPLFYYPFLLIGEIFQWWLPYFSPKFAASQVSFEFETHFAGTIKFIKHRVGEKTPDANHTVLHLLTLVTLVLVFADGMI